VSWQDHSIEFQLDRLPSALPWLRKNIESMKTLSLIYFDLPKKSLKDLLAAGR
jgi:hypothetical protein